MEELRYFFSYAHEDSEFVLKLAEELRAAGAQLWLDKLDIRGGQRWDRAVEEALETCQGMIVVLSPVSVASHNVLDEVSYALDKGKLVVPILLRSCEIPLRLWRVQYTDFTASYDTGFSQLLRALRIDQSLKPSEPAASQEPLVRDVIAPSTETPQKASRLEQLREKHRQREEPEAARRRAFVQLPRTKEEFYKIFGVKEQLHEHYPAARSHAQLPQESIRQGPPRYVSPKERIALMQSLNSLPARRFNMLVFALRPPSELIPPMPAPQGDRVSALLTWAEGPGGCGLAQVQQVLHGILPPP